MQIMLKILKEPANKKKSIESILQATMLRETCDGLPEKKMPEICGKQSILPTKGIAYLPKNLLTYTLPNLLRKLLLDLLNQVSPVRRYWKKNNLAPVPVFDIVNAGERHRFCTANFVAHNCLGLSYGCGWHKFVTFAEQLLPPEVYERVFGAEVTTYDTSKFAAALSKSKQNAEKLELFKGLPDTKQRYWVNSWKQVEAYRESNPAITEFWKMLDRDFKASNGRASYTIELPNGRTLRYHSPKSYGGSSALMLRMGRMMRVKLHGGVLTENVIQAVARDVFADCILRLDKAGVNVILHAHDEAVCMVDEANAEEFKHLIEKIMSTPPDWMPDLPQAAEAKITKSYTK